MPKELNLISYRRANRSLTDVSFKKFLDFHDVSLKPAEIVNLAALCDLLADNGYGVLDLENFCVGYRIPQIGKEFDLLRFGEDYHINVELKSTSTEEKIISQLKRNKYYLSFLDQIVHYFTYQADTETLYRLQGDDSLDVVEPDVLAALLKSQKPLKKLDLDSLFNPSDYLVSPFNSTERFLNDQYFLTSQQEEIQKKILEAINANGTITFTALTGSAGTGKTLLAYDIVKSAIRDGRTTLVIHCGYLNDGHQHLKEAGWNVISIREFRSRSLEGYDLVLVDEAQRLMPEQVDRIKNDVGGTNAHCLFAYDRLQTLASHEERRDAVGQVSGLCAANVFSLSEKIRTNKEIANFLKSLLDKQRNFGTSRTGNIQIRYFDNLDDTKSFLAGLNEDEWQILRFTPSQYNAEHHKNYSTPGTKTSHEIIGQEFEGVAVVIDSFFTYDADGKLVYRGRVYYSAEKMLFQNITRARKRLLVVVLKNEELLDRCMSIA